MKVFYKFLGGVVAVALFVLFLVFLSGRDIAVLNPEGMIAFAEKNLLVTAVSLMMIVIIPVFVMLFAFAWWYREGNIKARYVPEWSHNKVLELVWWAIPFVIVVVLAIITWKSTHDLDPYKTLDTGVKPMTIQVVALEWKWLFIYPEQHIATVNLVEIPVGTPIRFEITADAPMNSFWIPKLGGQIYAMPGMNTALGLVANTAGDYPGVSANFSGAGFSGMKFVAEARTQAEFDQWVATVRQSPNKLTLDEYTVLAKQSKNNPATYYGSVADGLFESIMMKFMAPAQKELPMEMVQ
jgi:cytochrome o ubiquinol oxidase subunit 2